MDEQRIATKQPSPTAHPYGALLAELRSKFPADKPKLLAYLPGDVPIGAPSNVSYLAERVIKALEEAQATADEFGRLHNERFFARSETAAPTVPTHKLETDWAAPFRSSPSSKAPSIPRYSFAVVEFASDLDFAFHTIGDMKFGMRESEHGAWVRAGDALAAPSAIEPLTLDTPERVCFYEQEFYVLSNFSSFKVSFAGIIFDTSEHAYHWNRFPHGSPERTIIRESPSAHEAFRFAQDNKHRQLPNWDAIKVRAMGEILRAKVRQHEYVRRKLLETGERLLVENSWRDPFWGWGPNRDGQNMLGKLWMEIRAELRASTDGRATPKEK